MSAAQSARLADDVFNRADDETHQEEDVVLVPIRKSDGAGRHGVPLV